MSSSLKASSTSLAHSCSVLESAQSIHAPPSIHTQIQLVVTKTRNPYANARTEYGIPQPNPILLVQEDKRHMSKDDAEAQLIAGACAAFSENNRLRAERNLPQLASMTFPGVTLVRARPTFYKITVTAELLFALATAQYPAASTIVEKLVHPVPDIHSFNVTGMQQLNNRVVVLQCFQAFKNLVHNFDA